MFLRIRWLVVAFIGGVLCCALSIWIMRRIKKKGRASPDAGARQSRDDSKRSTDGVLTPEKVDSMVRVISTSTDQVATLLIKVCSLLQDDKDDREALLGLIDRRSQEVLQMLGQAVYHVETEAQCWRDLRPSIEASIAEVAIQKQRTAEGSVPAGPEGVRNPPTVIDDSRLRVTGSVTELIAANFARVDLETSRRFEEFRKRFMEILGTRVIDIKEEDGAVLFLDGKTTGLLWPWPNNTIQKRWREFFQAPKGENAPVRAIERPAVVTFQSDQWVVRTKGAVRQ